jgi:hypothetical protein
LVVPVPLGVQVAPPSGAQVHVTELGSNGAMIALSCPLVAAGPALATTTW